MMNKDDRKRLEKATALIEEARGIVEEVGQAERDKFDNLPEGIQESERGQKFDDNAEKLDEAGANLQECIDNLADAMEG